MNNLLLYFKWGAFSFTTFSFLSDGYFAGFLCEGLAKGFSLCLAPGGSNSWPVGHMQPRMVVNVAQHKILNLFKTL